MPAFLMSIFGIHIKVLYAYFYFGSILCLILCILIAKELFKTRYVLYLMTPVLIGRTFPRVVFTYWGGMRYAFGLLAVWFIIKFFKNNKPGWMFGAGLVSAVALFTSIEMGAYPFFGVVTALIVSKFLNVQNGKLILKGFMAYCLGMAMIVIPYGIYLVWHSALIPYLDGVWTIVTRMQIVIDPHLVSIYPRNFPEAFVAMVNPSHTNFKHMTPSYLYIFIFIYLFMRLKQKVFSRGDLMIICLGVYGFIMYNTGFRGIWAAQFEMALQPEKILMFFLIEVFILAAIKKKRTLASVVNAHKGLKWYSRDKWKIYFFYFLMTGIFCSSFFYSLRRFDRRFFAYKYVRNVIVGKDTTELKPLANEESRVLKIERAAGIMVTTIQANDLEQVAAFVENYVKPDEELLTYPDLGTYSFLIDRRYFGKFPMATFTWFNERWHQEYMAKLRSSKPRFVILQKELPETWEAIYLALEENRKKYYDVMDFIPRHYRVVDETPLSYVYELK